MFQEEGYWSESSSVTLLLFCVSLFRVEGLDW